MAVLTDGMAARSATESAVFRCEERQRPSHEALRGTLSAEDFALGSRSDSMIMERS